MSDVLTVLGPTVGLVGGLVGLIAGGLQIYYGSSTHRMRRRRFEREEQVRAVEAHMDDLRRRADALVRATESASTLFRVPVDLTSDLDFKAARKLCRMGEASMEGSRLYFVIDTVPKAIRQQMERMARGTRTDTFG